MVEVHEQRLVQLPQLVIRPRRLLVAPASIHGGAARINSIDMCMARSMIDDHEELCVERRHARGSRGNTSS
jgi:hypothetical protein